MEFTVIAFDVKDMTCGHCVRSITQALTAADPGAQVAIDLARQRVEIEPRTASAEGLRRAIAEAGYTPSPAALEAAAAAPARGGCGCGSRC